MEIYYEKLKKMTVEEIDAESKKLQEEHSKLTSEFDEASKSKNVKRCLEISDELDVIDRKLISIVKVLFE